MKKILLFTMIIGLFACRDNTDLLSDKKTINWLKKRQKQERPYDKHLNFKQHVFSSNKNKTVIDLSKAFRGNHYDHGNGIAVADFNQDGFQDVVIVSQIGGGRLYLNNSGKDFIDKTDAYNIKLGKKIYSSVSLADLNNDGLTDIVFTSINGGNVILQNVKGQKFIDISESSNANYRGHSVSTTIIDVNNDGFLDLIYNNVGIFTDLTQQDKQGYCVGLIDAFAKHLDDDYSETTKLFMNQGNMKFVDKTEEYGLENKLWSGDSLAFDYNQDRFPDIYMMNMQGDDEVYINNQGKSFSKLSAKQLGKTPWGSMGGIVLDSDANEVPELYIVDMHSDMFDLLNYQEVDKEWMKSKIDPKLDILKGGENNLFGNAHYKINKGQFTEQSSKTGLENYWPWGVSAGDFNADGINDLFVTGGMGIDHRYGINNLMLFDGKKYHYQSLNSGIEPRSNAKTHRKWMDLDCEKWDQANIICIACYGKQKKLLADSSLNQMISFYDKNLCQDIKRLSKNKNGKLTIYEPLSSRSSVAFDYDNDGDIDIITNELNESPIRFENLMNKKKKLNYIKLKLVGSTSNKQGLGAYIRITFNNNRTVSKFNYGKSGYLSQSDLDQHFNFNNDEKINEIFVRWPSGKETKLRNIQANQRIIVNEA